MEQMGKETIRRETLSRALPQAAAEELRERFDWGRGGFRGVQEEREEELLLFLLEYARRAGEGWACDLAEAALDRRGRTGGPLLAWACLETCAQTGRSSGREAACDILDGALKELRLPGGAFGRRGDDTVSPAWNARMIAALAKASRVLGEDIYLRAAQEARLFLKTRLTQSNGRLWRRWRDRTPMDEGRLEDYGFCCWALTELYEADFSVSCLREAEGLADRMADIFRDPDGGFFDIDGTGSGAAGLALAKLARLTGVGRYRRMAREQLAWLAGPGRGALDGMALLGMVEELWPRRELVCACAGAVPSWLAAAGESYRLAALAKTPGSSRALENAAPFVREFPVPEAGERLYLCRDGVCQAQAGDLAQLGRCLSREDVPV